MEEYKRLGHLVAEQEECHDEQGQLIGAGMFAAAGERPDAVTDQTHHYGDDCQPGHAKPWRAFYCVEGDHDHCRRDFGSVYVPGKGSRPLAVCECLCHERPTP